jgi:RHS repeat-associated protein
VAFLFFGWAAPNAARAMFAREAPMSIFAARCENPNERVNGGEWATYYVLSDPQGNVAGLATADGTWTLVAQYDYDPYGRLIRETGPKAASCPFRYSTKYRDPDLELYYYGYRWYDAAAMKWLTPDPLGERGGANLTAFCDGDPINKVDPLGLETEIVAMLRFRYGFEFLARHKNLRP